MSNKKFLNTGNVLLKTEELVSVKISSHFRLSSSFVQKLDIIKIEINDSDNITQFFAMIDHKKS